jgi:hypothetical protein
VNTLKTEVSSDGKSKIDMVAVYRSLLRVVAQLTDQGYTEDSLRQATVLEHDDLPNPASEATTRQG